MNIDTVIKSARIPFLVLAPVCVFLGVSTVIRNDINIDFSLLALVVLGALLAHISVNTFNEYFDFKNGLDLVTDKTPFSGGSGALPENPEMDKTVLTVAILSLAVTILIGTFFIWKVGIRILPAGITGILLVTTYTQWLNKHPFLCLLAPGLGFGLLMVTGTYTALSGEYSSISLLAALVPFFLSNNLLLLNQFPDIQADASVGRMHLPIAYGIKVSSVVYAIFLIATVAVIISGIATGLFPTPSLLSLLPLPFAFFSLSGAIKYGETIGNHPVYLASNVVVSILCPLILGVAIISG